MRNLWIAFVVLATLGSIYPFDFQASAVDGDTLRALLATCCTLPGRGDLVGNIVLFLPFGFTGLLALRLAHAPVRGILALCLFGAIFALALQLMQVFLPSRDENLQDVVWNVVGTAGGALLAVGFRRYTASWSVDASDAALAPLGLIAAWLIYKTIPFVPSIDLQSIKDSLKPLLYGELDLVAAIGDCAAWIVVASLLRRTREGARLDRHLPAFVAAVLALEVLIVNNAIDRADLFGAALAVLLWAAWLGRAERSEPLVLGLLLAALTLGGLAPFALRADSAAFNWLPFHGFLSGSMYINAQSAAEKVFLYGSLVFLLGRLAFNRAASLALAFAFIALIEVAQLWFAGHTPEITDPLLVVLAALALFSLEERLPREIAARASQYNGNHGNGGEPLGIANGELTGSFTGQWQRQRINLRREQYELLLQLAREMNVSVSSVARLVIQRYIEAAAEDPGGLPAAVSTLHAARDHDAYNGRNRWVSQVVNLHDSQVQFLASVAAELKISLSATARSVVAHFVQALPDDAAVAGDSQR